MIYIGVDPGASGGIARISEEPGGAHRVSVVAMPLTDVDIYMALLGMRGDRDPGQIVAAIEQVHAFPRQGVASTWKFGVNFGALRMALVAAHIPFTEVSPLKWQNALGCRSRGDKNITKARAQELFPGLTVTHAVADALLLAEYGRRQHRGR